VIAPAPSRSPWQRLYAAAHRRRAARWLARAERLPVPVWSVGNLHWGGTGKTPVVAAIAAWLHERGVAVAVLSRGYGRRSSGPLVVSDGSGPSVSQVESGDEPWLLAEQLRGVPVAVAARRADAARLLLSTLQHPPALFLLDDGFSHLQLSRELDLLVVPADDPFGGGRLLPSGRLREPLAATARASAVLVSGDAATPELAREVGVAFRAFGFPGRAFASRTAAGPPLRVDGDGEEGTPPTGPILLVTGIAQPQRVRRAAEAAGLSVAGHLALPDHHSYPPATLRSIARAAAAAGAAGVLTTAKDRVKLAGRLTLPLWELPVTALPEPAFWEWLATHLPGRPAAGNSR
jgi:tetraacyldisaccharide 4'-kinase